MLIRTSRGLSRQVGWTFELVRVRGAAPSVLGAAGPAERRKARLRSVVVLVLCLEPTLVHVCVGVLLAVVPVLVLVLVLGVLVVVLGVDVGMLLAVVLVAMGVWRLVIVLLGHV